MSELSETNLNLPTDTEINSNVQEGADLNNENTEIKANDKASKVRYLPELDPSVDTSNLSKRQIKKLRKTLQYEQTKVEKKKELKAKDKAKRAAKKELFDKGLIPVFEKPKPIDQIPSGVNVILDMDFESLMLEKEVKSVVGQVGRCYAANKRVTTPVHIKMTGVESKVDVLMSKLLRDYKNWKMFDYNTENFVDLIEEKDKLVYLTADSDNIIENLEVGNYYIIGGIVDKNRHKVS
jgi:tRNA (guanine9-N1)-methyltransferase